jgi:predicted nucleotidyltransferase component of viral defense system
MTEHHDYQTTTATRQPKTLKYPLEIAEKDYHLALAVKLIGESPLGEKLVFKGGTAIHHCYLPQHRFSEDLDFTALVHDLDMSTVTATLESSGDFTVKKKYESPATIKIERLSYKGILDQPGAIKVEIDRKQNVALPPVKRTYENVWNVEANVQTMQLLEVTAEKIRAAATRVRYRDFYDLFLILEQLDVDVIQAVDLLKQKEIRTTVGPEQIAANWQQAQQEAADDLRSIFCTRSASVDEIGETIRKLRFEPILRKTS